MTKYRNCSKPKIVFTSDYTPAQCDKINRLRKNEIEMGLAPKLIYVNKKQKKVLEAEQKDQFIMLGRGGGKSKLMQFSMAQRKNAMPKGTFFVGAPTFKQLLGTCLKGLDETFYDLGWKEKIDYVKWKSPPKGFQKPLSTPETWQHFITFRDGTLIQALSFDRPDTQRGGSWDGGDLDERALISQEDFNRVILPGLRGNLHHFGHIPLHRNVRNYTSMPRSPKGYYLFEYQQKHLDFPDEYLWVEGNVYDNIEFWGEDGIERLRRTMSHLEFRVEVMNERINRAERPFYNKFNPDYHIRTFGYDYAFDGHGHVIKGLKDLKRDMPIDASFDFGGWFTCCTGSQYDERGHVERFIKECYRNGEDMLRPVIEDFCKYFEDEGHRKKLVKVYGEPRGWNPREDGPRVYDKVVSYFVEFGWTAIVEVQSGSKTDDHAFRYDYVNEFFAETNKELPRIEINAEGCPNLVIALQVTSVKADSQKDKSKESDRDYPQEHAPHLTDTFDYKLVQKYLWKLYDYVAHRANESGFI